jgi:hypothetical protein
MIPATGNPVAQVLNLIIKNPDNENQFPTTVISQFCSNQPAFCGAGKEIL